MNSELRLFPSNNEVAVPELTVVHAKDDGALAQRDAPWSRTKEKLLKL
jgi:hypothetical protein